MQVTAIKTHPITPHENLEQILDKYLPQLGENSVLAITSKIISLCEGRIVAKTEGLTKEALVEKEADQFIDNKLSKYDFHLTIKYGILIASAGIDESNTAGDHFVLWPENPEKSAISIWNYVRRKRKLHNFGVIITDSKLAPLRWGVTGVSIAYCGFRPLNDFRGKPDVFGRPLHVTQVNVADGLAASAVLAMGESNEQTPLAVVSEIPFVQFVSAPPTEAEIKNLLIDKKDDLYAPLIDSPLWQAKK